VDECKPLPGTPSRLHSIIPPAADPTNPAVASSIPKGPADMLDNIAEWYYYAVRVGVAHGDLDFLELIDGRAYKLQCRSVCRTRQTEMYG
jgi:hypothetical protein